jgi:hypothetical protein
MGRTARVHPQALQYFAITDTNVPHDGQRCRRDALQTGQKCQESSTEDVQRGQDRLLELPHEGQKRVSGGIAEPQIGHVRIFVESLTTVGLPFDIGANAIHL